MFRFLFSLLLLSSIGIAQIPAGYYNSAQGLTGQPLKTALHNIIKNHTVVSYNGLWSAFNTTDKKSNGKIWDIYSDIPSGTPAYQFTYSSDQCGNYTAEGDCYNREHSWPQSWFNSVSGPQSDLFHIYATDGYVNGQRSSWPFANNGTIFWTSTNGSTLGIATDLGYNGSAFEPIDEYKGDLARSYFYMSTRYESEDAGWTTSAATNLSTILPWQLNVLIGWHHFDPVSTKEINRNNAIYNLQDNRNPYIDNPQWADSVWLAQVLAFKNNLELDANLLVYPNPCEDILRIDNLSTTLEIENIEINDVLGKSILLVSKDELTNATTIDISEFTAGIYFIEVNAVQGKKTFKVVKK
ncbi:MAG: endonuclease [Bacteroidetes bacterium]|nr:endonuclease [Bacteroidota bacterium]